jgi:fermentation-respiration switch protein FrsA (DUF1100 family)
VLKLLLLLAIVYVGISAAMWLAQERFLFYPPRPAPLPAPPRGWGIEEVVLATRDGTRISGVLLRPPVERPPLVIYFGGNAQDATLEAPDVETEYGARAVLLVNYRGYGRSEGKPGETAIVADALELFDWAARRTDIDAGRIAVHGRSLGSGVAVRVAAERPVRCVVLTSPFESALAVARAAYPWLPVALLMRHRFDSAAHAPRIKAPALFLIGEADTLITPAHSRVLEAAWGGPVEEVLLPGMGHNDVGLHPRYADSIRAFLDRHL